MASIAYYWSFEISQENLKAYGVKEAEAYLDQARTLEVRHAVVGNHRRLLKV